LSTEKSRIDAILLAADADKDSFAEIVSLINSVDTTNDNAFAAYVLSNDAALSSELVARASGDASLEAALSSSVSTANASIDSAISSEVSNRIADVDAEESRAMSVEAVLSSDLSSEVSNRIADVDAEESRAMSVEAALSSALSSEISRAEAAEGSLEIALSSEVSYLLENTDLTSIDSFAEVSAALSTQVSDFQAIYFHKASFTGDINGMNAEFTLSAPVRSGSEVVYLNGLLQEAGVEYTVAGSVVSFVAAPQSGDKVVIYGVY